MESDANRVWEGRPFYFTHLRAGDGTDDVTDWVLERLVSRSWSGEPDVSLLPTS